MRTWIFVVALLWFGLWGIVSATWGDDIGVDADADLFVPLSEQPECNPETVIYGSWSTDDEWKDAASSDGVTQIGPPTGGLILNANETSGTWVSNWVAVDQSVTIRNITVDMLVAGAGSSGRANITLEEGYITGDSVTVTADSAGTNQFDVEFDIDRFSFAVNNVYRLRVELLRDVVGDPAPAISSVALSAQDSIGVLDRANCFIGSMAGVVSVIVSPPVFDGDTPAHQFLGLVNTLLALVMVLIIILSLPVIGG